VLFERPYETKFRRVAKEREISTALIIQALSPEQTHPKREKRNVVFRGLTFVVWHTLRPFRLRSGQTVGKTPNRETGLPAGTALDEGYSGLFEKFICPKHFDI
jgi:hypothetical protein